GELDRSTHELAGILLQLRLEPLEQRERVRGRAGETADHVALVEAAHLGGIGLHDGLPDRDLPVAADNDASALADGENCRAVPEIRGLRLHGLPADHDVAVAADDDAA